MSSEADDFGRPVVTASGIQAWLDRLSRRRTAAPRPEAAMPPQEPTTQRAETDAAIPPAPPASTPMPPSTIRAPRRRPRVIPKASIAATAVLALLVWGASGFYRVEPDQVGLVLRFGALVDVRKPGLNYHWPYPIEAVLLPRVTAVNQLKIGNGAVMQMLTGDENIVEATASISWRVKDPAQFLFDVYDPESAVRLAGESAVRQVIGLNPIQSGLSDQRQKIADDARTLLQRILDSYNAGIDITQVELQRVDPPLAVIDAFNDVQRARADQQRALNEAEAYRNDILPRARAEGDRMAQEAQAYRQQVLDKAHSDADRFDALQASYAADPELTARRLYLDTMEDVLKSAGKVVVDPSGSGAAAVIPYLPLGNAPAAVLPAPKAAP